MAILKFIFLEVLIFIVGLGIDYIFVILEKKEIIDFGSFLHILANGLLIFIPLSIVNKKNTFLCITVIFLSAFVVFSPVVIIKYNYVIFLSVAVYTIFAIYIACKKTKYIGVR